MARMPELPDVCVYLEALERKIVGQPLGSVQVPSPFVLCSYDPPIDAVAGRTVAGVRRIGKRIVYAENECNYCATCQTGGKLPADRSLSRLLKDDWPKSIDDL